MSIVDEILATCPLRPGPFPAAPGACAWCGAPLGGRRRRWCSQECSTAVARNHEWGNARLAALRRDDWRCVQCGNPGKWLDGHAWFRVLRMFPTLAGDLGEAIDSLIDGDAQHRLEVNHIIPIVGRHAQWGCHHHVDGLETLCRPCHKVVTRHQFATGQIKRGA